jgi:hypothetical protein
MSLVRVTTLVILAAVIGAGVAYALVGLIRPDDPAAVAPVVIDPTAGTQRAATTTAPRTTTTTPPATTTRPATPTTRPSTPTTRTEPDDDGWKAGPPIADDDSGKGRGRGRGDDDRDDRDDDSGDDDSSGHGRGGDD